MKGASAPCLCGYARTVTELHKGLDGALTVTSARPAGQAARDFIVELLAGASWPEQRRAVAEQRPAMTRRSTA
jgi:hypothetical protein